MSIENKGVSHEETENINNTLSENKELQKVKETLEKRETIEGQEKVEMYLGYLVNWKNEIIRKQDEAKQKVEKIYKMDVFINPKPDKKGENQFDDSDVLLSDVAEKFNDIQSERNDWADKVSSTIYSNPYNPGNIYYPHDNPKVVEQYFFVPSEGNNHIVKLIEELGLNKYEYQSVAIPKKVLEGELPLYEVDEDEHSTMEKWLSIEDGKFIVKSASSNIDQDGDYYGSNYHSKEFNTYKEAVKSFVTNNFLKED